MRWFAKNHRVGGLWSLTCVMALALIDGHAVGQCELDKLLASDRTGGDEFGRSVSISGSPGNEVAIVGAYQDDAPLTNSGSAYIYRRSGASWVEEQKLLASDGAAGDEFGISVSISGDPGNEVAIVGAWRHADNGSSSGSAYIYRRSGAIWVQETKLLASDGEADDRFGWSVSISGTPGNEVAIIGAYLHSDNGVSSGSAYIYRFDGVTWVQEAKLLASDGAAGDWFGYSVSISGDTGNEIAIVGAINKDGFAFVSGSAHIYRFNGAIWVEEGIVVAFDGESSDQFGISVSISGAIGNEVAIVGAHRDNDNGTKSGSAYIFRRNSALSVWIQEAKLLASDGAADDRFGISVSISGPPGNVNEVAIVGAYVDDDNGTDSGSAYIFRRSGASWAQEAKLFASDGAAGDLFGFSVSVGGDVAIVGALRADGNGADTGSAYVLTGLLISGFSGDCNSNGISDLHDLFWHKTSADCNDNGIPDECDIASGASVDVDINGIPDECLASCPPDVNSDGNVNVTDLLALLGAWGACP